MQLDRKAEARRKIQLGGLLVKAGFADEPSNLILGIMLAAREVLSGPDGQKWRALWSDKGGVLFRHNQNAVERLRASEERN